VSAVSSYELGKAQHGKIPELSQETVFSEESIGITEGFRSSNMSELQSEIAKVRTSNNIFLH
jgi:hypothetical protein